MLARAATATDGQLFIHGGGVRQVALAIPAALPIAIAARFVAEPGELGTKQRLGLRAFGPDETEPFFTAPPLDVPLEPQGDEDPTDPVVSLLLAFTIGTVPLSKPGMYRFELLHDDEVAAELPLYIRDASTEQDSA
jgi:Family of unknown function (DUF6941)